MISEEFEDIRVPLLYENRTMFHSLADRNFNESA